MSDGEDQEEQMIAIPSIYNAGVENFEIARQVTLENFKHLSEKAQEDVVIAIVTRKGAIQWIGQGACFPTNEEIVVESGIMVFRDDILADEGEEIDETKEKETN